MKPTFLFSALFFLVASGPLNANEESPTEAETAIIEEAKGSKNTFYRSSRHRTKGSTFRRVRKQRIQETAETPQIPAEAFEEQNVLDNYSLKIGEIVSVNEKYDFAVAYLETRFLALNDIVISRDHELQITGIFRPNQNKRGRATGLDILYGKPTIGQTLVSPNERLKKEIAQLLPQE